MGAWIAWGFAVVFAAVYLWHFFQAGEAPLSWKEFAILEGGALLFGLALFTAPGNVVDLIFDRLRGEGTPG